MNAELQHLWAQAAPDVVNTFGISVPLAPALARFAVLIAERCAEECYGASEATDNANYSRIRALANKWRRL